MVYRSHLPCENWHPVDEERIGPTNGAGLNRTSVRVGSRGLDHQVCTGIDVDPGQTGELLRCNLSERLEPTSMDTETKSVATTVVFL